MELPLDAFEEFLDNKSKLKYQQDLERLKNEKRLRTYSNIKFIIDGEPVLGLLTMNKIPKTAYVLVSIHLCYDFMHDINQRLDEMADSIKQEIDIKELILEGSRDYIYYIDMVNDIGTFSPKALDVLPLESSVFSNAMDKIMSFIISEDRNIFLESFTPFLTGKSKYHIAEYRVKTKQGKLMWISCYGKGTHDEEGKPQMLAGSLVDITEKKEAEAKVQKMLYYDLLTGLKNRYCYEEDMAQYLQNPDAKGSIIFIDIRNFKLFNELFGYNFGNKILKEFANLLNIYIPNNLDIYRLGGDEFLIHMPEHDKDEILERISPLQIALSKARIIEGHNIFIDMSIGVAIYPEDGITPEELLTNGNTVLYKISKNYKEKIMFFDATRTGELSKRYNLENELRNEVENKYEHFRLVYQPIIKIDKDGNYWHSAEALLRYSNPAMPNVAQMELIECLEISDLILPVGRWVIQQAVKECSQWNKMGANAFVHVNLSAKQLSDAGLLQHIKGMLGKYQLEPKYLICELTETSLVHNFETATSICRELMDLGVGIALDDFGTGYSSFNYLRKLPISQIKVDKDYVQDLVKDDYNRIIISCLYDLSKNLGLDLCVEGVETKETLDILTDMGVNMIQGFYFERPLEADIIRKEFMLNIKK